MVDEPHKQDGALNIALQEDVLLFVKKYVIFMDVKNVLLCSDNARNYGSCLVSRAILHFSISTGLQVLLFLHSKSGDGKTLLDTFFGLVSMALSRWLDGREHNVVTLSKEAAAVTVTFPCAAVSILKADDGENFVCIFVC